MVEIKAHEFASFARRAANPYPVALVFGPDRGLVSERAAQLAARTGIDLKDDFAVVRLEASEISADPARLLDEMQAISLFGGDRLVWLKNAGNDRSIVDAFNALAQSDLGTTKLIAEAGDLKKTGGLRKAVAAARNMVAIPCYSDDAAAVQALIDEELGAAGLSVSGEARQRLTTLLGGDRLASRKELQKLALYCHGTEMVSDDDVFAAMGDVAALSVDDAVDAVLAGEIGRLDMALDRIEKSKIAVFLALRGTIQQLTLMDLMRGEMETEGRPLSAVMSSRGRAVHFKRKPIFERALRNWTSHSLRSELVRLNRAVYETRSKPAIEFSLARNALMRTCLISRKLNSRRN
ncbi:DNA polymerase III subunit delta [Pseudohoeflea coraliihabitans]|uniref:DNA polymerase III subunit delta n=1 Tax=Pseudohoeflea coraliihabitans TaxID=2860393 RepID=A0ABS6WT59_9HYPH|nr:DNA polymerase III subunit delta [Pseudohoeflea sp. DP4N28-3]MBW3099146.1 DNA polymerase III subunit delta [Pseudohoeflea sp. DP4N28-3]